VDRNSYPRPLWSTDGRELFFRGDGADDGFYAVDVSFDGQTISASLPKKLFERDYGSSGPIGSWGVGPDGLFTLRKRSTAEDLDQVSQTMYPNTIQLVHGWTSELP